MCRSELKSLGCLGLHLSVVTVGIFFSFFFLYLYFICFWAWEFGGDYLKMKIPGLTKVDVGSVTLNWLENKLGKSSCKSGQVDLYFSYEFFFFLRKHVFSI